MRLLAISGLSAGLASCAPKAATDEKLPVAVLGDSDSHSYHDSQNGIARGGANTAATFNWLEVWQRLRPDDVDMGSFSRAGDRRVIAKIKSAAGLATRTPRKQDYLFNYAWSGARCASLIDEWPEQALNFETRLKSEPRRWRNGLLVIRIGVNDFGQVEHLTSWAANPAAAAPAVDACLAQIKRVIETVRRRSSVHIALVGVAHDYDLPGAAEAVPDNRVEKAAAALDRFDAGLKAMASEDPRIAFVEDVLWFETRFGGRRWGAGATASRVGGLEVAPASGDAPEFLVTTDGHAGTIASGLFLQSFIAQVNEKFGWTLSTPMDEEIAALARS